MKREEIVSWSDICEIAMIQQKIIKLQEKALENLLPTAILNRETEDAIKEAERLKTTKYWEI